MSNPIAYGPRPRFPLPLAAAVFSLFLFTLALLSSPGGTAAVRAQDNGCAGPSVCNPTVKPGSRTPAAVTGYEVKFETPRELAPITDGIVMVLHEDIGVPRGINPFSVRVSYISGEERRNGGASAVELNEQDDPRHPTTMTIYPAIRGDGQNMQPQPIPANSTVTVTFDRSAGISNPTEGGAFSWQVHTSKNPTPVPARHPSMEPEDEAVLEAFKNVEQLAEHLVGDDGYPNGLLVDWEIQLSHEKVHRGEEVTVIGRGYKNGTTLTFWRDADFDGARDSGEEQLCQANVEGNDIGYCTFIVNKPPFVGSFGQCVTKEVSNSENGGDGENPIPRTAADNADCNFINGVDGLNHSSIWIGELEEQENGGSATKVYYNLEELPQVLELEGLVLAEVAADRRLSVQMRDFPQGELTALVIGGVPIDLETLRNTRVPDTGALNFTIDLPGGARRGFQSLRVVVTPTGAGDSGDYYEVEAIIWVEPDAIVASTPEKVLPNQRISLKGNGFIVEDGSGEIAAINIGGHFLDLSGVNGGEGPEPIDRNGSWRGFVDLPINSATTTPGTRELRIVDSQGRGGTVEITIPTREIEATPIWGRPGAIVTVKGTGFPALNRNQSGVNVRIYYDFEGGSAITSAEPDAAGNFSVELRLPLKTPAPSSNTIRAEFEDDNGTIVVTTTAHEVPGATVAVDPQSGPPGTPVSLTGQGFRKFTKVNSVIIGDLDVTPGGAPTTDANGEFSLTFLAPGAGVGTQTVLVTIAGATASAPFDISPSGVAAGATVPVAEALEELGDALVRTFHFNNDTKVWTFYDPELTEDENSQGFMIAGETYLVLVRETVSAILNGKLRNLSCYQGNCWNQIIW